MKVLFVSSGTRGKIGNIVKNQGESLIKSGVQIDYFIISEKGFKGYIKSIPKIRKAYRKGKYDLVHAHYSLSAFAASCAGGFPLVVSLMGSDAYLSIFWRYVARLFYHIRWQKTIVKTEKMQKLLRMKKALVIPNGVDIENFKPMIQREAQREIGFDPSRKLIIFVSNPNRSEKDYPLALKSVQILNRNDVDLMPIFNIRNEKISNYMNAADLLLLTSKREGSPNVVKEAMACNTPIVSTDVGDVKKNIMDVTCSFIAESSPRELALKIDTILETGKRSNGREKLISLGLDSDSVAKKIISVYKECLND
jgi:teichuronic acid biosynthesis glycosyltransferase TuaC